MNLQAFTPEGLQKDALKPRPARVQKKSNWHWKSIDYKHQKSDEAKARRNDYRKLSSEARKTVETFGKEVVRMLKGYEDLSTEEKPSGEII